MPFLKLDDVELFFTDEGTGPPVLLVHGWACDSHDWSWQHDAFVRHHRVIAADNRGHGRSSVSADGYRPRVFANDLAQLIARLDAGPVVAVGHSLGGAIVSALAVEHPELVRAVVAVDPAYGIAADGRDMALGLVTAFRGPGGLEAASAMHRGMDAPTTPPGLVAWHGRRVLGMPQHVVAETFAGLLEGDDQIALEPDCSAYMVRRSCPVLAIYADQARADHDAGTFRHPYSRSLAWEGAGHWLHQERPTDFNDLVLDWIAGLPNTMEDS